MSAKLANGLKVLAWAAVVGACMACSLMVERTPRSNLQASQLAPASAAALSELRPCQDTDLQASVHVQATATCAECTAVCDPSDDEFAPMAANALAATALPATPTMANPGAAANPAVPQATPATTAVPSVPFAAAPCGLSAKPEEIALATHPSGAGIDDSCPGLLSQPCQPIPLGGTASDDFVPTSASPSIPDRTACPPRQLADFNSLGAPRTSAHSRSDSSSAPIEGTPRHDECAGDALITRDEIAGSTSTVTMRDKTNRTVATLKISSAVTRDYLKPEEREAIAATCKPSLGSNDVRTASRVKPITPRVDIFEDPNTGHFTIDAESMELQQLAVEISARLGYPVRCLDCLSGTVSACVTDTSVTRALERLVGPFGCSIANLEGCYVIGTPEALRYEARRLQDAREWEQARYAQAAQAAQAQFDASTISDESASAESASAERLPPVEAQTVAEPQALAERVPGMSSKPYEISIGNKAKELIAAGDLETTTSLLQEAVTRHQDSAILYRMLAEVYLHRGMYLQARTAIQQSLALNRNNPMANQIYGEVLKRMGEKTRSAHYLEQAKFLRSQARL